MIDIIFRILTFILIVGLFIYWRVSAIQTEKEKPTNKISLSASRKIGRVIYRIIQLVVLLSVFGLKVIPYAQTLQQQVIGFIVVLIGIGICMSARKALSDNWTHAAEYQIKKSHQLITSGIYKYIRHPIYSGFAIIFIGAEIVAGSWLWVSFLALFIGAYAQGKREEKILIAHFGDQYKTYMRHSKMLIPFLF